MFGLLKRFGIKKEVFPIRYVNIPNTDLNPSVIALGTANLGTGISKDDSFRMLDTFVAYGGTFIDTAHNYADWRSEERSISEKTIGAWLAETGKRDEIVLATKGAHLERETRKPRVNPKAINQDLNESLEFLRTDQIDLYFLHRDDPEVPIDEIMDCLETHKQSGKIRYYGCSNWRPERIQEAARYADSRGFHGFVANQLMWSLAEPNLGSNSDPTICWMDEATYTYHTESGMAVLAFSSQARGFFSGKYGPETVEPGDGRHAAVIRQYASPSNFARLEKARVIGQRHGLSANEVALAYLMHQPFATYPIIGPRNNEQMLASLRAVDITLTDDDIHELRFVP